MEVCALYFEYTLDDLSHISDGKNKIIDLSLSGLKDQSFFGKIKSLDL